MPGLIRAAEAGQEPGVSSGSFLQAFLGLFLILAIIFLLAFLGKRFLRSARFGQKGLKLLGGIALGPRERIVLVEAGDQWLVVGVVPGQIRTLHTMPRGESTPDADEPPASGAVPAHPNLSAPFADWLRRFPRRDPS
ncbi:MAG: flagellar biosynthetic protein FliO [Zoogloeaceae bacterium]|nr:flagellar biosynthetic protein FliO [Zoogloeaceae bacterium]